MASVRPGNGQGIAAMLAGTASFTVNDVITKLLGGSIAPGELMFVRGVFATLLLSALLTYAGTLPVSWRDLATPAFGWRLAGELGSTMTFIIALMHLRLADSSGIQQFQPLAVTAGSAIFLHESVGLRRWLAALIGLFGVLLIVKPGTGAFEPYALLSGVCVLFIALRDLATRSVTAGVPSLVLALSSAVVVAAGGVMMAPFEAWAMPQPYQLAMLAMAAVLLVGGYLFVTIGVRIGELSVVSPFRYAGVIFAVLLQLAVWGQLPDALALTGMALVVGAGVYTFRREQLRHVLRAPVLGQP